MIGLKPCPFCGHKARLAKVEDVGLSGGAYVHCSNVNYCNARTPTWLNTDTHEDEPNYGLFMAAEKWNQRSIDAWNTRPKDDEMSYKEFTNKGDTMTVYDIGDGRLEFEIDSNLSDELAQFVLTPKQVRELIEYITNIPAQK